VQEKDALSASMVTLEAELARKEKEAIEASQVSAEEKAALVADMAKLEAELMRKERERLLKHQKCRQMRRPP
jgi:hypothetical protein